MRRNPHQPATPRAARACGSRRQTEGDELLDVRRVAGGDLDKVFASGQAAQRQLDLRRARGARRGRHLEFTDRLTWFLNYRPDLAALVSRWNQPGMGERRLLSLLRGSRMKKLLRRMLDETEFLSDYGVRAVSRYHRDHPYTLHWDGQSFSVGYQPGESTSGLFGGNSNWRGPIWMPVNYLIIESLQKFHHYYGDDFKVECPTGSGRYYTIEQVANELATRLTRLFLRDEHGRRPVLGENRRLQDDPHFRDYVLFHEYFHGDTGRGVGASHQTGWTGLVAKLLQPRRSETASERDAEAAAEVIASGL